MEEFELREIEVTGEEGANRLDRVLAVHGDGLSRSRLKALIVDGRVAIAGHTIRDPAYHVARGDTITIRIPPATQPQPKGEAIPLSVVYEDDQIVVIDKPAGLVVHPAAGHDSGTLVNALIAHCGDSLSGIGGVKRPGIVHRLDKDTTGLMVVAKTDRAHRSLTAQFADHGRTNEMRRGYYALVWGDLGRPHGTVNAPIDRHPHAREKMAVRPMGREAVTHYQVLDRYAGIDGRTITSAIACELETGRTHQIRVHMAHLGHPLLGDAVYGAGFKTKIAQLGPLSQTRLNALRRQALHAYLLVLEHPLTGEIMSWETGWPDDLERLRVSLAAAE